MMAVEIFFAFAVGAAVGSFLNVCIWRLPRGMSILWPASHCPRCLRFLRWYHNIPLLSYLLLRAKCAYCGGRISLRYPLVEAATGASFAGLYLVDVTPRGGGTADYALLAVHCYLVAALLAASIIDLEHQIIPDGITVGGVVVGLLAGALVPGLYGRWWALTGVDWLDRLTWGATGALVGGGVTLAMAVVGKWLFRREAMGMGDVKLMTMLGAFLGWSGAVLAFFIAPFFGLLIGGVLALKRRSRVIPYGPFLSMAAVVVALVRVEGVLGALHRLVGLR